MNLGIQTITGRILEVGAATFDAHCHTYEDIEVETAEGVLKFGPVLAASVCDEALTPGRSVSMAVTQTAGKDAKLVVWAVLDKASGRVFKNEELYKARQTAATHAFWLTLIAPVVIPVGLLLALIPGLLYTKAVWEMWAAVGSMPAADAIEAVVDSMSARDSRVQSSSLLLAVA